MRFAASLTRLAPCRFAIGCDSDANPSGHPPSKRSCQGPNPGSVRPKPKSLPITAGKLQKPMRTPLPHPHSDGSCVKASGDDSPSLLSVAYRITLRANGNNEPGVGISAFSSFFPLAPGLAGFQGKRDALEVALAGLVPRCIAPSSVDGLSLVGKETLSESSMRQERHRADVTATAASDSFSDPKLSISRRGFLPARLARKNEAGDSALTPGTHLFSSPFAAKSVIARARCLGNSGRFTQAETCWFGPVRLDAATRKRQALKLMLLIQGRKSEVLTLILNMGKKRLNAECSGSVSSHNPAFPIDYVRNPRGGDSGDDRIWLAGQSGTWTGEFDEAAPMVDRCTKRRLGSSRMEGPPGAGDCAQDLDGSSEPLPPRRRRVQPVELLRLRIWVIARLGAARRNARPCLPWSNKTPAMSGWDRLAELALKEGQLQDAKYRKRRQVNTDRERTRNLIEAR